MQRNTRIVCAFGAFLLVFGIGAGRLNAQATAAISGTITDTSGAAISDAMVQARNIGTGITANTNSDSEGRFRFSDLAIGNYEIQAVKAGFSTELRRGITLTVGSQPVLDFQMTVGQQTQTINVEGQVSQVETQSTSVGALVESKQMTDLPLNGRNFTQLLTLAPGVTQIAPGAAGAGSTFYGNGQKYSIAGSRPSGQAYLLDDQDMNNFWNNGPGAGGLGTALGVDAIAEFQTLTNTYSTQFGGNGAVINASSKSGTNAFHGSAFEFLRNNKLESRNEFDGGSDAPPFRRNQFGGSIGGPIKKDKIFFFANYEGLRQYRAISTQVTVPDQCAHKFLKSTAAVGVCGGPVAVNSNPQIAQAIANTLALYPNTAFNELPGTGNGLGSGTGNAFVIDPTIGHENYLVGRVDYTVSDKSSIFFRYVLDRATRDFTTTIPLWPELDTTKDHFVSVEERQIISPRMVNLLHAGFSRTWEDANVYGSPTVANGVVTPGTIASAGTHPLQFFGTAAGREDGNIATFAGITAIGGSTTLPFYLVPNKFQVGDDVIWSSGAHSIKAGFGLTRLRENTWAPFQVGGVWTFTTLANFLAGSPSQVVGQLSNAQDPTSDATKDYRYTVYTGYVDDQWKITKTLTLTLGLRYSPTTKIGSVRHKEFQISNPPFGPWIPTTESTKDNPSLMNLDPRIGLAWDPFSDHKTSIRASFGMFHNVIYSRDLNQWLQPPFQIANQSTGSNPPVQYLGTCATLCSPFTIAVTPGTIPTNGTLNPPNSNFWYVNKTPYQEQWNFNIQREIMANTVFSAGYLGSHNVHMFMQLDFNPPNSTIVNGRQTFALPRINPQYGALILANTIASSHYHALQTSLNRRFSNNWQMQVSYTFSKSIDNSSGTYGLDGGGLAANGTNPTCLSCDTGLSNFNRAHNFRLSGIYHLPFKAKGAVGALVNDWQLAGGYTYLSGAPFSPLSAANRVFTGSGSPTGRPDVIAGCDLYTGFKTIAQWFNPSCYALQPAGTYGNAGRTTIIGPNLWNVDASLLKDWKVTRISEQFAIQFRAEAFNLLNHPSLQQPNNTVFQGTGFNASAGRITGTTSDPRIVQLAMKVTF